MSALGRFDVARVQAELEQHPETLPNVRCVGSKVELALEHLDCVLGVAPAVAALVALCFAERPEALHLARRVGQTSDDAG